jgi:Domain of unknown function (DUF6456)
MTSKSIRAERNSKTRNLKTLALGAALSAESGRLLRELAEPGRYATMDPTADESLILRCARDGVSLGAGRFSSAAAAELRRHDLIEEVGARSRPTFRISEAGLRRLKRQGAAPEHVFAAQHHELVDTRIEMEGRSKRVTANASESPLAWLRRRTGSDGRPLIDEASFQAGERLRRDLTFAAILPRIIANWSAATADKASGAPRDPAAATDQAIAARQRVTQAFEAVGPDFADLLIDLCGFFKALRRSRATAAGRSAPARSW